MANPTMDKHERACLQSAISAAKARLKDPRSSVESIQISKREISRYQAALDSGVSQYDRTAYFAQRRAIANQAIANGEVGPAVPLDPHS